MTFMPELSFCEAGEEKLGNHGRSLEETLLAVLARKQRQTNFRHPNLLGSKTISLQTLFLFSHFAARNSFSCCGLR